MLNFCYMPVYLPFGNFILLEKTDYLIALCPAENMNKHIDKWLKYHNIHEKKDVAILEETTPLLIEAASQLNYYLNRDLQSFTVPISAVGTTFQQQVWKAIQEIPYGETTSYGNIGEKLKNRGFQSIGNAVGSNPLPIFIPCHRVLPADGHIGNFSLDGGAKTKAFLLDLEGARYKK